MGGGPRQRLRGAATAVAWGSNGGGGAQRRRWRRAATAVAEGSDGVRGAPTEVGKGAATEVGGGAATEVRGRAETAAGGNDDEGEWGGICTHAASGVGAVLARAQCRRLGVYQSQAITHRAADMPGGVEWGDLFGGGRETTGRGATVPRMCVRRCATEEGWRSASGKGGGVQNRGGAVCICGAELVAWMLSSVSRIWDLGKSQ